MRNEERSQKRAWRQKKRAAATAALRPEEACCFSDKGKWGRPAGRTCLPALKGQLAKLWDRKPEGPLGKTKAEAQ